MLIIYYYYYCSLYYFTLDNDREERLDYYTFLSRLSDASLQVNIYDTLKYIIVYKIFLTPQILLNLQYTCYNINKSYNNISFCNNVTDF